jgi:hypothetical protein
MKYFFLLFFVLAIPFYTIAQDTGEKRLGSWVDINSINKITNKISVNGSFTSWNYELTKNQHLSLGLIGVYYKLNKNTSVGLLIGRASIDSNYESGNYITIENRIAEQLSVSHGSNKVKWNHRFRLEHRFFNYKNADNKLVHRIRYRFKGKVPISKMNYFTIYDEIHFNLNEFDFNQNRIYGGIGTKLNKNLSFDIGYVRHSFKTKSFHRLAFQLNISLDFRKQKLTP